MKISVLFLAASGLGLLAAPGCSSSSGGETPPAQSSSSGALSGKPDGAGVGTEAQILCLSNFYCNAGTVCCGNMATMGSACSTGPICPLGQLELCQTDSDCKGTTCSNFQFMGINSGTCGLGLFGLGGSSSSSGGSSASSSSSGGVDAAGGDGGGGDALDETHPAADGSAE
jgi:hypothetical protein